MKKNPLIGITLDSEEIGGYSSWYPWYAIRKNYVEEVTKYGGTPVLLPHDKKAIKHYSKILDGLIVTGGDFDIHPKYYGAKKVHPKVKIKKERTEFEYLITKEFIKLNKPVLGICGGEQLINVIMGGTLVQDIPDEKPGSLVHTQKRPRNEPEHAVEIKKGTLLHKIIGSQKIKANSTHHQSVAKAGKGVVINAIAPDGIIEGLECPGLKFCLGVQWHPEYRSDKTHTKIFAALVKAASK